MHDVLSTAPALVMSLYEFSAIILFTTPLLYHRHHHHHHHLHHHQHQQYICS